MQLTNPQLIMLALGLLIAWRIFARIRRLIGRQKSRLWRHWMAVIFLPFLVVLLGLGTAGAPLGLAALAIGTACGIGLAVWGLRLTRFEATASGYFFTPDTRIGIALSLLLVARIGYRLITLVALTGAEMQVAMQGFSRSPLTLLILGMLLGYYLWYAVGLLQWRRIALKAAAA